MQLRGVRKAKSLHGGQNLTSASLKFKDFNEEAAFLRKMADNHGKNPAIRERAMEIIRDACESRNKECQALEIGKWVQKNIYYVHEGFETFQTPIRTLETLAGDCDDFSTLICALLTSVGIKNAMCIIKIGGHWAHIFPVALIPTSSGLHRMTLDATMKEPIADLVNPIAKVKASGRKVDQVKFV